MCLSIVNKFDDEIMLNVLKFIIFLLRVIIGFWFLFENWLIFVVLE